jgi:hypothetical protein
MAGSADPSPWAMPARPGILHREVIPDPRGLVGFGFLALLIAGHLLAIPDREGRLFAGLASLLPGGLRGPLVETCVDGVCQSVLLLGPLVSVYAALRHLALEGDSLIPYFTLLGGGFLTILTGAALLFAFGRGAGLL